MADQNPRTPQGNQPEGTAARTATGFWAFFDEIKDEVIAAIKKLAPYGVGAVALIPLVLTREGRDLITEFYHYARMQYGEQIAARVYDWSMRSYILLRRCVIWGLVLLLGLGMAGIMWITRFNQIDDRAWWMMWDLVAVSLLAMFGWAKLAPLVAAVGAGAGALTAIGEKELSWGYLRSLPSFLLSGGKTGLQWLDGWWKIVARIAMFFSIGAFWYALAPFHNHPPMKYVAALLIPVLFWTHVSYRPGPARGPFWWWTNWATAFTIGDITLWLMWPEFKDALWPSDPAKVHSWLTWVIRSLATVIFVVQLWWTIHLARLSRQPAAGAGRMAYQFPPIRDYRRRTWGQTLFGVALLALVIALFWLMVQHYEWGSKITTAPVHDLNAAVDKAVGFELLPNPRKIGDGYIPEPQEPLPIRRLPGGWVEVEMPAGIGWYRSHVILQPGQYVSGLVTDSTYTSYDRHGAPGEVSTGGIIDPVRHCRVTPENSNAWFASNCIRASLPAGALLLRHGLSADPMYVGYAGWTFKPAHPSGKELYFGLNVPQLEDRPGAAPHFRLSGTIKVRMKVIRTAALSTSSRARPTQVSLFLYPRLAAQGQPIRFNRQPAPWYTADILFEHGESRASHSL
ncbi:MAG: hypothetical protein HYY50_04310 [Candidatus Kerfeldbacteria bacterium]|nr:hypothetical protein [Candidatus Kerfeldbacteria bacterium]